MRFSNQLATASKVEDCQQHADLVRAGPARLHVALVLSQPGAVVFDRHGALCQPTLARKVTASMRQ